MHTHRSALPFPDLIGAAKLRLTIPSIWEKLGLPGTPGKSCRSPFREDRAPSFSIYANGTRWKDHATGENGDALDFMAKAMNRPVSETVGAFLAWAGIAPKGPRSIGTVLREEMAPVYAPIGRGISAHFAPNTGGHRPPFPTPVLKKGPTPLSPSMVERENGPHTHSETAPVSAPISLPPLSNGTPEEKGALAGIRKLPSGMGVALAVERGLLGFATLWDNGVNAPAWFITDAKRVNAQARRLDGLPWQGLPGTPKARTWRGACAGWPIGATDAADRPLVLLCEGGPDLLSALTLIALHATAPEDWAALAVTGASQRLHPEALTLFRGKRVRILPHADKAGAAAALRWDAALATAGVKVDWFDLRPFLPPDGKDLNDALAHDAAALAPIVRFTGEETEAAR